MLRINGAVVDTATGAAVQGHPAEALALAANALAARGEAIEAGSIVLTGGMTDAVFIHDGDEVSVEFTIPRPDRRAREEVGMSAVATLPVQPPGEPQASPAA